ncbi:nitrite reductase small subunit NirD [Nesterenkonia sp. LB17]|uniref:nitrite reductase small subunit NirD n=1 Tax=unclassified Nesterenkonia TaxID=2629769 RepID=UPI001F4CDF06|nr:MULTISPECIES: nitrite reductase small subunit NirD [unclassified Nesterenkonia]MCH8560581.1 nitrite reductase small subunit NirD [Nesterenkonia sp. DZ6]MCH8562848.1 nitrite reductase small subunit NirD [Nesterenkonia sp. YGD6]MCH8565897.1 nitrite reductase small subunit NirD [Nesterenkonia sp. LB17]MCH8570689.1 nitrite reductase small subunit NirD [Nesterenkonia sp. AY15]
MSTATTTAYTPTSIAGAPGTEPFWHRVCRLEDLEPMWGEAALVQGTQIALIRLQGETVHAVSQLDPCAGANVMSRGIVGSRAGRPTLASPIHKQPYDLATGQCLSDEALQLNSYPVRVQAGFIEVKV